MLGLKLFHASEGWTDNMQGEKDKVIGLGVKEGEYCVSTILYDTSRTDTTMVLKLDWTDEKLPDLVATFY